MALALIILTFSSSSRRTKIHSPFSFLPPSPATIHGNKQGGVVTSVFDKRTTPGSKQGLKAWNDGKARKICGKKYM